MQKKIEIYKKDKWNMIVVEVKGTRLIVMEISDQWGEDTFTFQSRPALMHWVHHRFTKERFDGSQEELEAIIHKFSEV